MIGDMAIIEDAMEVLKNKGLVLKIVEGQQDYLSCKINLSEDKKRAWLGHPINQEYRKEIWQAGTGCLESQDSQ